jgi:fatty-acyl-CoA synthase
VGARIGEDRRGGRGAENGGSVNRGLYPVYAQAALARGIDVFAGYGMSETCPILTSAQLTPEIAERDADGPMEIRAKAGRPVPLVDLRIVDEEMRDVPCDGKAAGEVVVRAPWLTQGYLGDARSSEQLWRAAIFTPTTSRASTPTATSGSPIVSKT